MAFAAVLLVLVQAAVGIVVNLYVAIPARHPGAHPGNYLSGSLHSIGWAIAHGAVALAIHATLGIALVVVVLGVAIHAWRLGGRAIAILCTIAALLVIGAGFNGASFLDFNHDASSLVMALLAFAAIACYTIVMFLLADTAAGVPSTAPPR
jgi:predicted exporter